MGNDIVNNYKKVHETNVNGSRRRKVYSISKDGVKKFYEKIKDAVTDTGISATSISNALKGRFKTAGKLKWYYDNK